MQSVRPVVSAFARQVRRYHGVQDYKAPHMNELPSPNGSWQRLNEQRQRRNNMALIGGATVFAASFTVFMNFGIRFNYYAPEHYE